MVFIYCLTKHVLAGFGKTRHKKLVGLTLVHTSVVLVLFVCFSAMITMNVQHPVSIALHIPSPNHGAPPRTSLEPAMRAYSHAAGQGAVRTYRAFAAGASSSHAAMVKSLMPEPDLFSTGNNTQSVIPGSKALAAPPAKQLANTPGAAIQEFESRAFTYSTDLSGRQANAIVMMPSRNMQVADSPRDSSLPYEVTLNLERTKEPIFPESRREPPYPRDLVITLNDRKRGRDATPDFEMSFSLQQGDTRPGDSVPFFFHELK